VTANKDFIQNFKGEVYDDPTTLALYATDASLYQMLPQLVVVPQSIDEVRTAIKYAVDNQLHILPRGSATSLAGQTVNKGMVIDFSKYFRNVVEINTAEQYAIVQPGVIRDQLNKLIAKDGLHFAPDPATSSRASFGGMIANNSSGTKSILYGKTSDHVISLKVMTLSGNIITLEKKSEEEYEKICNQDTEEGAIYRGMRQIIFKHHEEIEKRFPKVMRRVGGYALDAFINTAEWNLAHLITGSEGTLCFILEAKIKLTPLPKFNNMVIVHFDDRLKGIAAVKDMIQFRPAAVEMLDFNVLQQSKFNAITKRYYDSIIQGDPQAVMTVEFYGDTSEDIASRAAALCAQLKEVPSAYAYPITTDKAKINDALDLRKDGLGLIMSKPGIRKPLPFVEDAAIPLEHLAKYIDDLERFCQLYDSDIVLYAHASVGVLHVRPTIDLTDQEDIDKMKLISDFAFELVKKYKGSWSSEHGDGRVRSPKIKAFYGEQIYQAFLEVKNLFDPKYLLNPNIIIGADDMRKHLRYYDNYKDQDYPFVYKYRNGASFQEIVHNCSGVGACRNADGGVMCPSFKATGNEVDSTRGRANILRLAMSGQMQFTDLTDKAAKDVLDLCLSCKACKTECPSNVDMSKLKAEVQQLHYDKYGASLKEKAPLYASSISKIIAGPLARIVNPLINTSLVKFINKAMFGISPKRDLPLYATQSLASWHKPEAHLKSENKVVLFADTYINYHETQVGKDVISLLNKCGYEVILADVGCCQRPRISNGFLKEAKKELNSLSERLYKYTSQGLHIITIEPSCTTALIDDLPDLIDDIKMATSIKEHVMPVESFLLRLVKENKLNGKFVMKSSKYMHHGHCHQKAVYSTKDTNALLSLAGADSKELDTGCCGMAGAFGYEAHHYDLSVTIANQKLVPSIKANKDCSIIANGYSCRHQVADLADAKASHIVSELDFISN
jgi:FAD/FMN-containing dehydrogenase/Fe-S oxidoreductase